MRRDRLPRCAIGVTASHWRTSGVVCGQVIRNDVNLLAGVRFHDILQEPEKPCAVPEPMTPAVRFPGGHGQRGEQVRRTVPHVVVGAFPGGPEVDRQQRLGPIQRLDRPKCTRT
jgi:hypothetical protein